MADLLYTKGLSKSYGEKQVLSDIELHIQEGELVGLLGVSGIGKTTLLNLLSGLERPDSGSILVRKEEGYEEINGRAGTISYMLQKDLLFPQKNVIDNVSFPLRLAGKPKKIARECAAIFLSQFGLEGTEKLYPAQLSGGMRQRAALLRTYLSCLYLSETRMILLDEPFSALDAITRTEMQEWYLHVVEKLNLTTLFITHDIDEAILMSDRIFLLGGEPGRLIGEIKIESKRPREKEYTLSEEFLGYKKQIRKLLEKGKA